jgi:small-conductance mechanosensitive channel
MDKYSQLVASSFDKFKDTVFEYLPSIGEAIVVLVAGSLLAWLIRWLILRLGSGMDLLYQKLGFGARLHLRWPVSRIIAGLSFWLIILFFASVAVERLRLPGLAELLNRFLAFLPSVLLALIILGVGVLIGGYARDRVRASAAALDLEQSELLGGMLRFLILTVALILAVKQLGLDIRLIEEVFIIAVAAFFASAALAFGLGAGLTVSNIISSHYVRKTYRAGQRVRVHDIEGEIIELTPTAIVLDTANGRTLIPAKVFNESASVLLDEESADDA